MSQLALAQRLTAVREELTVRLPLENEATAGMASLCIGDSTATAPAIEMGGTRITHKIPETTPVGAPPYKVFFPSMRLFI
jgi:hypothetical protein